MSEELSPEPKKPSSPGIILWLVLAFIPSVLGLALLVHNRSADIGPGLVVLDICCSVLSGLGVAGAMKNSVTGTRIFLGLLLGGAFFVLNVIIVFLIGCSSILMGLRAT